MTRAAFGQPFFLPARKVPVKFLEWGFLQNNMRPTPWFPT
jgi:hypothetical protein